MMQTGHARLWAMLFVCLALSALLDACSRDEPVTYVDLSKREEIVIQAPAKALTYAYLPQYSHTVSYERHKLLVEYLQQATGMPIRQIFPGTFEEHVQMVERGEIDISFSNPFVYVRLAGNGSRAFARIIEPSGKPDFYSQIICRKDNKALKTLEDCRGKRWIAVDPASAGGYLFALGLFYDHGIRKEDFAEVAFAPGPGGAQEKVVLAVYAGVYDLGSVRDGTLAILKNRIDLDQIRILAESRHYPGWVYSARRGLDAAIVERLAKAMFALDMKRPEDAAILAPAGMRGIISADDAMYDPVRELAGKLAIDLDQGEGN
jgi:phosphonate transport system substrate-binding protein